ncbi:hypothetical protein Tco_0147210 [Tanacetum coccineum]
MTTRSDGQATTAPLGGRTGGRTGRGGGRTRGRSSDLGNDGIDGQGGPVGGQGTEVNDSADGVPNFSTIIAQQLQNLLPTILAQVGDQGSNQEDDRNQNENVRPLRGGTLRSTHEVEKPLLVCLGKTLRL